MLSLLQYNVPFLGPVLVPRLEDISGNSSLPSWCNLEMRAAINLKIIFAIFTIIVNAIFIYHKAKQNQNQEFHFTF